MRRAAVLVSAGAMLWSLSTRADPIDKDADAERLFREGQKLMGERRFGEACPKFETAYRKDQQLGTLLNLAYCHKEQGAHWQAWLEFKEAEGKAIELKRNDRRDFARHRMAELEKALGKAVIEKQNRVELTEILVEDRRVPGAEKGQPFAVETGQRKFTFRATGKEPVVQLVTIKKSDRPQRIPVPEMEDEREPEPVEEPDGDAETRDEKKPASVDPPARERDGSTQRIVGLAMVGGGVIGVGVGSFFGLKSLNNPCVTNERACNKDDSSDPDVSDLATTTTISTVSFILGGALLAGGAAVYFLAPKGSSSTTSAKRPALRVFPEIGAGWASLRGVF